MVREYYLIKKSYKDQLVTKSLNFPAYTCGTKFI